MKIYVGDGVLDVPEAPRAIPHNTTVVGADKIIILEEGHIVEQGTHAELTASGGLYARMWTDYNKAVQWKITSEKEAE